MLVNIEGLQQLQTYMVFATTWDNKMFSIPSVFSNLVMPLVDKRSNIEKSKLVLTEKNSVCSSNDEKKRLYFCKNKMN